MARRWCLVLLCLALYEARPAFFESDLVKPDHNGVFRKTADLQKRAEPKDEDLLEYEIEYNSGVIRLDQEHKQIEAIECFSNNFLRITLAAGSSTPSFSEGDILVGGKEWGCQGDDGVPQRFAVRVNEMSRSAHVVMVSTSMTTQKDVFKTLRMGWKPKAYHEGIVEKRDVRSREFDKKVSWNYDEKKVKAVDSLSLWSMNCKSPEVKNSPSFKAICATPGFSMDLASLKCSNCWASFNLDIIFQYDQNQDDDKTLTTIGVSTMNIDITVSATAKWSSAFPSLFSVSAPMISFGIPGIADIALEFTVTLDFNITWSAVGEMTSGSFMEGNFTTVSGYGGQNDDINDFVFRATPNKVKTNAKGDGSIKTTLRAGPHFKVYLFMKTFFNAYAEIAPYLVFNAKYNLLMMPPIPAGPKPKALVKSPWMLAACASRHFVEWDMSLGVAINVGADGLIIFGKYAKVLHETSWDIAAGCLLPLNVTIGRLAANPRPLSLPAL